MNDLLLWMSTRSSGSAATLRAKAAELSPGRSDGGIARHLIAEWNLSQLAHAEFGKAARNGWRVAPPVLAAGDPCNPTQAVLCGARTPQLLREVLDAARELVAIHPQRGGPDAVIISATPPGELLAISRACGIPVQWNAPLVVLGAASSPHAMALQETSVPVGAWIVTRFSKTGLAWVPSSVREAQAAVTGLFRFRSDQGSACILKERGTSFTIDPAHGKYRILKRHHRALRYDAAREHLSAAVTCRPPELVQRALALCSGRLPEVRDGLIVYAEVSRRVAESAAALLRQRLY